MTSSPSASFSCRYAPTDEGILCRDPERYFNRPLYGPNRPSLIVAGEMPSLLLVEEMFCLGRVRLEVTLPGAKLQTLFTGGVVEYQWEDFDGNKLRVCVFPASRGTGSWMVISADSKQPVSLRVHWSEVGVSTYPYPWLAWCDPCVNKDLMQGGVGPMERREGEISVGQREARVTVETNYDRTVYSSSKGVPKEVKKEDKSATILLRCEDATLSAGKAENEIAIAFIELTRGQTQVWWGSEADAPPAWQESEREIREQQAKAVVTSTPCAALDAAVSHVAAASQGHYYAPFFVHGCMSWNMPYLGWNVYYGAMALGWADRLQECIGTYLAAQETAPAPNPGERMNELTLPGKGSHFYGRGYVDLNQDWYNMQELFFDQMIEAQAHRLLGDLWLTKARPGLAEHRDWSRRCFDPEDDGLYTNGINAWATDSIWYSGGAGSAGTAFAYRVHVALGDADEAARIQRRANEKLWLPRKGWYAEYAEATGEQRLHESACLYAVCYPITCGMADEFQSWQLVHYARHELEQITFENHPGRLCWLSQWVPYEWSVRENAHGDTLTLALAAFMAGRADLGWEYFQGVLYHSQYDAEVPGGLQMVSFLFERDKQQHATDFTDPTSLYLRALSQGLAGFRPVVNGPLCWAPGLPEDWTKARLDFPLHGVHLDRVPHRDKWVFRQQDNAPVEFILPVPGHRNICVTVEGLPHDFELLAKVGAPRVRVALPGGAQCHIVVEAEGEQPWQQRLAPKDAAAGMVCEWEFPAGIELVELNDPQTVLARVHRTSQLLRGCVAGEPGQRVVFAKLRSGECEWWQPLEISVRATAPQICHVPQGIAQGVTAFQLEPHFNGRLQYLAAPVCLEPRSQDCSAQVGNDGRKPWTHLFWNVESPSFDTTIWHGREERLVLDGIPFLTPRGESDAVLVSQWQHLERVATIPFSATLQTLYVLVAVSTNVMQSHMEVLRLTIQTETGVHVYPLVHPRDVWSAWGNYDVKLDRSCLPEQLPRCVELGKNSRACLLQFNLPKPERVTQLSWECSAPETIGALLGLAYA